VNGYLPMSWLKDHNPDINWEMGRFKWRSEYCIAHYLRKERRLEFITEEELFAEDQSISLSWAWPFTLMKTVRTSSLIFLSFFSFSFFKSSAFVLLRYKDSMHL